MADDVSNAQSRNDSNYRKILINTATAEGWRGYVAKQLQEGNEDLALAALGPLRESLSRLSKSVLAARSNDERERDIAWLLKEQLDLQVNSLIDRWAAKVQGDLVARDARPRVAGIVDQDAGAGGSTNRPGPHILVTQAANNGRESGDASGTIDADDRGPGVGHSSGSDAHFRGAQCDGSVTASDGGPHSIAGAISDNASVRDGEDDASCTSSVDAASQEGRASRLSAGTSSLVERFGGPTSMNHAELSRGSNATSIESLRSAYNGVSRDAYASSLRFELCHCDISTVVINTTLGCFSRVPCDLGDIERTLLLLPAILGTQMDTVAAAKTIAKARMDRKYANANLSATGLLAMFWAFSDKGLSDSTRGGDPIVTAARKATNRFEKNELEAAWKKHATFPQPVKGVLLLTSLVLCVIRVLAQVTFDELSKSLDGEDIQDDLEDLRPFCERMCGQPVGGLSLKRIVEKVLVPAKAEGSKDDRLSAMKLSKLFTTVLVRKSCRSKFKRAESAPVDQLFDEIEEDELKRLVSELQNTFMCEEKSNGEDKTEYRRRIALRVFFYLLNADTVAGTLANLGLHELDAERLSFALFCSRSSDFRYKGLDFFFDEQLYKSERPRDDFLKALGVTVEDMFKHMCGAVTKFRQDHIFVGLTDDLRRDTTHTLDTFVRFFARPDGDAAQLRGGRPGNGVIVPV